MLITIAMGMYLVNVCGVVKVQCGIDRTAILMDFIISDNLQDGKRAYPNLKGTTVAAVLNRKEAELLFGEPVFLCWQGGLFRTVVNLTTH